MMPLGQSARRPHDHAACAVAFEATHVITLLAEHQALHRRLTNLRLPHCRHITAAGIEAMGPAVANLRKLKVATGSQYLFCASLRRMQNSSKSTLQVLGIPRRYCIL